jgi:anaerobic magnesium-protoporphyrin IX monomethyl ester cyclase
MRVLLVNPPWVIRSRTNVWRNVASIMPPLGVAWLAAVLEQEGHAVSILDAHAERLTVDQVAPWIRARGGFDLVGITATTPLIGNALEIARQVKREWPGVRMVLGGVHPTVLPAEVLAEPAVDVVVRGEGENTLREIAAESPLEAIQGISYRRDGQVVHNPDRELIPELDSLPLPAYHLLPMGKYRPAAGAAKRTPATSVLATRGCPGRCTFCYRVFGNRLRFRSGRRVAEEVQLLQDRYGIREICFYDDTFTAVPREVRAFCAAIQDLKLDLTWSCFTRIDAFHEETFRMMKDAGCHQVMVGVESASAVILKNINKRINVEKVEHTVHAMQRLGLEVRAAFMLGNPGETEETLEENIRFALKLKPDLAQFNITTPFPGTEMFHWAEENGCLLTKDWEDYDLSRPVMKLPTVAPEVVQRYYNSAHRRFFLRPQFLLKRVWRLRSPTELVSAARGLRMVLKM